MAVVAPAMKGDHVADVLLAGQQHHQRGRGRGRCRRAAGSPYSKRVEQEAELRSAPPPASMPSSGNIRCCTSASVDPDRCRRRARSRSAPGRTPVGAHLARVGSPAAAGPRPMRRGERVVHGRPSASPRRPSSNSGKSTTQQKLHSAGSDQARAAGRGADAGRPAPRRRPPAGRRRRAAGRRLGRRARCAALRVSLGGRNLAMRAADARRLDARSRPAPWRRSAGAISVSSSISLARVARRSPGRAMPLTCAAGRDAPL